MISIDRYLFTDISIYRYPFLDYYKSKLELIVNQYFITH